MNPSLMQIPEYADLFNRYERDQRLLVTKRTALALAIAGSLGFIVDISYFILQTGRIVNVPAPVFFGFIIVLLAYIAAQIFAYQQAQRRNLELASSITIVTCTVMIVGLHFVSIGVARLNGQSAGLDERSWQLFMAYLLPIVLSVVIGEYWLMYTTVGFLNIVTTIILIAVFRRNGIDTTAHHELPGVWLGAMIIEWAVTIVALSMRQGFQRIINQATELHVAIEQAQRLDELKDKFISSVNHELRNPVMAMRGYLDALGQLDERISAAQRHHFINQAISSCQNMQDLIESILSVRRIDQGLSELQREWVDLREILMLAIGQLDPREAQKGERPLHVYIPTGMLLFADKIRLEQVLINLLSNALKYSDPGTAIDIAATLLPNTIELRVRDYGWGVPPRDKLLLFQKFVRLPRDLGSSVVGNGLGLYTSREIIEAHGGTITIESSGVRGEGSTFIVRLPVNDAEKKNNGQSRPLVEQS